jgi:formylmethanofuran dehydrogenase subunit E
MEKFKDECGHAGHKAIEVKYLRELLDVSAARHQHLCPRQALGVRMGRLGGRWLGIDLPQQD